MAAPTFDASAILEPLHQRIQEVASWNARNLMSKGRYLTLEEMDAVTASGITGGRVKIVFDMNRPKEIAIICDYTWFKKDELLLNLYKQYEKLLPRVPEKARPAHNAGRVVTKAELFEELETQARRIGYKLVPITDGQ